MTTATRVISCDVTHETQNTVESKKNIYNFTSDVCQRVSQKYVYSMAHKYLQHAVNHFTKRTGSKSPTPNTV